jgi:23S rRNA (adenine2503-C2)-methyltransferase
MLLGTQPRALTALASDLGMPAYRGRQLAEWLYRRHARSFAEMTNISKADRAALAARFRLGHAEPLRREASGDGTLKYAFPAADGRADTERLGIVETTVIPEGERTTLCVSTQIGCARRCAICATGTLGFHGNLRAGEIINQLESLPERASITNIVYMGMGEPLDNIDAVLESLAVLTDAGGYAMSPRRITVSTIGIPAPLERLLSQSEAHVAISLHSPFPEERAALIPAERRHPIREVLEVLAGRRWDGQRRLSFEYALIGGRNDTKAHATAVARLIGGLAARVNLIPVNPAANLGFAPPAPGRVDAFAGELTAAGVRTTVRRSRGADIDAACGLLAGRRV